MSAIPAVNAFVLKHTLKLIEAVGILLLWGFWISIIYVGWTGGETCVDVSFGLMKSMIPLTDA
jgi:hypothetical protein